MSVFIKTYEYMRKHCLGGFALQDIPDYCFSTNDLWQQMSWLKSVCVHMYKVGAKKKKKKPFSYYLLPICFSLEMYEMHRKSQAFAENENNVKGKKSCKWVDMHILFKKKLRKEYNNFDKLTFWNVGWHSEWRQDYNLLQEYRWEVHFQPGRGRSGIKKHQKRAIEVFPWTISTQYVLGFY